MTDMYRFQISLNVPQLDWPSLLYGHGWIFLSPHEPCEKEALLFRTERLPSGQIIDIRLAYTGKIIITGKTKAPISTRDRSYLKNACTRMLRLDQDYSGFHELCRTEKRLAFVAENKAGRLLRSPTVFEDVVKTILTTNCSWNNTKAMALALCRLAGGSFPTPEQLASFGLIRLKHDVKAGYRACYLNNLSKRILSLEINPESWINSPYSQETEDQIRSIEGVGPYAENHILMLLGRYDRIPLDSEIRKWISKTYHRSKAVPDSKLLKRYERFGRWQYLAFKFDRIAWRDNYIN